LQLPTLASHPGHGRQHHPSHWTSTARISSLRS